MIRELDTVVITRDFSEHGLKQGDIGAVVHTYENGASFEVEFITIDGNTVALLTLNREDIRPIKGREVLHVREPVQIAV
ncbi:MAG: DUF4926 domain-containing protein [Candidatus Aminicenantes bacterium]|nr:DUF4926 domain-containing protein [Candidatus Aminicenantes bacterium]